MKLMDEVAGIVAARHCKTNIVTASVDAINFHEKIKKGTAVAVGTWLSAVPHPGCPGCCSGCAGRAI